jgi:ABC transport system ATP-binding/permease protein
MWKLTIEDDQANKTVVHLVRDEYTIGRAEDNAIRLTERNISRHHAKVVKDASGWSLHDVRSYNGCYVNGARVGEGHLLNHGDIIQFGDYRLDVEDEALGETGRSDRAQTVPGLPRLTMSTQTDRLVELVGPEPGTEYNLGQRRMVIGRGEECDISINHPSVSRVHAELIPFGDGRYEVRDLQSANGLRVNAVELPQTLLDARDVIELGDVLLKYIPAGDLYIPGADDTQARIALAPSPTGLAAIPTAGKVAIGAAILAVLLAVVLALRGGGQTELPVDSAGGERASKILVEAKALVVKGDVSGALRKANEIPADSNLRDSAEFKGIYAAWADSLFAKAEASADPAEKRSLLDEIARATGVDLERRKRAASALQELGVEAVDINALPSDERQVAPVSRPPEGATYRQPSSAQEPAPTPKPQASPALVRRNPFDESGASTVPAPTSGSVQDLATSGDRSKLVQAKNNLQAKAQSGTASERDLKMLRALCRQLNDSSCSN